MLPSMTGAKQSKIVFFMPKLNSEEWQRHMEERRACAPDPSVEVVPAPSVEIVPQPSVQVLPLKRRGPGRPRKPRELVVDLTVNDLSGTQTTEDGTLTGSGSQTPPSGGKSRTDWMHPSLFIKIYRCDLTLYVSDMAPQNIFL